MIETEINRTNMLSIRDSNAIKGIALVLLLIHHLFYTGTVPVDDIMIGNTSLVQAIGTWCKESVALFVFLSGYGLTISSNRIWGGRTLWKFYKNRYLKLMVNYWFIYLLFVPLGVFVFGRTFAEVYHGSWVSPILDFFGLYYAATGDPLGYNPTWWFYGCIIMLYVLFPLLQKYKSHWLLVLLFTLLFLRFGHYLPLFNACKVYLPSFVAGMYLASAEISTITLTREWKFVILLGALGICLLRPLLPYFAIRDAVIALSIVFAFGMLNIPERIISLLAFVGRHSFNIFLFHTFIYYYYFHSFIYWTTNPILIFLTLFFVCIVISMILEYAKEKLGINKLQRVLTK